MENKGFLTLEEARDQAEYCDENQEEGVYRYKMKGKGYTLIEDGKVLVEGVDWVDWFEKGVYWYKIEGKGLTIVKDGEVLAEGAERVYCFEKGVYEYKMKGGEWVTINKNK